MSRPRKNLPYGSHVAAELDPLSLQQLLDRYDAASALDDIGGRAAVRRALLRRMPSPLVLDGTDPVTWAREQVRCGS